MDRVGDRAGHAGPVTDQAHPFDSQQRRSSVFVIIVLRVDLLHDGLKARGQIGINRPDLARDRLEYPLRKTFGKLDHDIPNHAIGDDDVGAAVEHRAPFDVADKVDRRYRSQAIAGFLHVGGAFLLLPAHVHQGDARVRQPKDIAGVNVAHHAVLGQMLGLGLDVRANINQDDRAVKRRNRHRDPRTMNVGQAPHVHLCRHHIRPGVAGGNGGINRLQPALGRPARVGQLGQDRERAVGLAPHCLCGRLVHRHHLGGLHHDDALVADGPCGHSLSDDVVAADKHQLVSFIKSLQRGQRSVNDRIRSIVAPHHVEADPHGSFFLAGRHL